MNPTAEQLASRLNPTATNVYIPQDGVFTAVGGYGDELYLKQGNQIKRFDIVSLLTPEERQQAGNRGVQINIAKRKVAQQYGFNPDILPKVNIGDFFQSLQRQGIGSTNAEGSYIAPITNSSNINEFITAKPSSLTTEVINGTKNTLTTPTTGSTPSATIQLPSVNLQPGSTGPEVKKLQDYLVSQGLMTQAQVNTGYGTYGPQTTAAVKALQEKLGVDNSSGVGYFGPKTMQAIASMGVGNATSPTGANNELQTILSNPGLSEDQKALIQNLYDTVSTNDMANAERIMAAFKAATEFSDPYFKAQTLIATDALSRALGATDGDLAFQEKKLRDTLSDLTATVSASKGQLDFNKQQELKKLSDSYAADLETTQQNLAATGKTSSSVRTKAERLLAEQNQGLVESTNRQFAYQTGALDRSLAGGERDTAQSLKYIQDKATQDKIANLRKTEEQVGSTALSNLGYTGLLGNVGGSIPRQKTLDALSFSNSFIF